MSATNDNRRNFVRFSLEQGVLRFGEFKVKSGRLSPYFFNAGLFNTGRSVGQLARFYAQALLDSGVSFDMLFGPAYKGFLWLPRPRLPWLSILKLVIVTCPLPSTAKKPKTTAKAVPWWEHPCKARS